MASVYIEVDMYQVWLYQSPYEAHLAQQQEETEIWLHENRVYFK